MKTKLKIEQNVSFIYVGKQEAKSIIDGKKYLLNDGDKVTVHGKDIERLDKSPNFQRHLEKVNKIKEEKL